MVIGTTWERRGGIIIALKLTEEEVKRLVALREGGMKINELDNLIKMRKLFDLHKENPTFTRADLVEYGFKTAMVRDYWAMFVKSRPIYQIHEWNEIMHHEDDENDN